MYAAERHRLILAAAREQGSVEVSTLAEHLDVTTETIRRDLTALENRGLLTRVHGGAIPVEIGHPELAVEERIVRNSIEKQRIAMRALEEISAGATILLDAGTTTLAIAQALPADIELTVVANSPAICAALANKPGISLLQLGGQVRSLTGAAVGRWTIEALSELTVDLGFIATNGFSIARGLTTPDQVEAATKRAMVRACRSKVLVADSTKVSRAELHRFADIEEMDHLITDAEISPDAVEALRAAGPEVILV